MRFAFLLFALVACGSDDLAEEERSVSPCKELRDHLVDLRVGTASGTPDQLIAQREALTRALGDSFVSSCEQKLSEQQISCALTSADLTTAVACGAQNGGTP